MMVGGRRETGEAEHEGESRKWGDTGLTVSDHRILAFVRKQLLHFNGRSFQKPHLTFIWLLQGQQISSAVSDSLTPTICLTILCTCWFCLSRNGEAFAKKKQTFSCLLIFNPRSMLCLIFYKNTLVIFKVNLT